jgi:acyl-CoA synthetase (AMP-forming)/AMP-acid ligase II
MSWTIFFNEPCGSATQTSWPLIHGYRTDDRIFTALPLYHSAAAFLAVASSWKSGSCVIIGRKFSARSYFDEARAAKATIVHVSTSFELSTSIHADGTMPVYRGIASVFACCAAKTGRQEPQHTLSIWKWQVINKTTSTGRQLN